MRIRSLSIWLKHNDMELDTLHQNTDIKVARLSDFEKGGEATFEELSIIAKCLNVKPYYLLLDFVKARLISGIMLYCKENNTDLEGLAKKMWVDKDTIADWMNGVDWPSEHFYNQLKKLGIIKPS